MADGPAPIRVAHVSKTYGAVRALVSVTCTIALGSVTVLRGPNGSGKSTLLALLGTLAAPTSGHVDHGDLGRTRRAVRRTMGWVGHDSLCYPDLTGRENVALAARLHGREWAPAVAEATMRFELGAFADRPMRSCSRGQRQRIALARALVHAPRLILLDEPTTGLDAGSVARVRATLLGEVQRGATVVIVTHDETFAEGMGGGSLWLDRGRIRAEREKNAS